ncbi:MAG: hypothetical protein ACOC1F_09475, partial [Myxococcota bacterium]
VVAGVRETFEEACLLPVVGGCDHREVVALRDRWRRGEKLGEMVEQAGMQLDVGALVPIARWVTPVFQRVRFDARFYLMALPAGQVGSHDEVESVEGCWSAPAKILERFEHRKVDLVPPTQWMLNMLSKYNSLVDVFAFAKRQTLQPICPEISLLGSETRLVLPGDPGHSQACRCLEGPTSYTLIGGRFVLNTKS